MSVRRTLLEWVGGFHSDNHDDMDMCHRVARIMSNEAVIYEPAATVRHFVSASRLTWAYFWRRCFFVNRGKVTAFRGMGRAGNLQAERSFARRALTRGVATGLRELAGGDVGGLQRAAALCAGLVLAGLGFVVGNVEWELNQRFGRTPGSRG